MPRRFRTLRLSYLILIQATKCLDLSYDSSSSELDSITLLIVNYVSCSFLDREKHLIIYLLGTWPESITINDLTGGRTYSILYLRRSRKGQYISISRVYSIMESLIDHIMIRHALRPRAKKR